LPVNSIEENVYSSDKDGNELNILDTLKSNKDEANLITNKIVLNKILGFITEHGQIESATYAKDLFYLEHFEEILDDKAVEKLSAL